MRINITIDGMDRLLARYGVSQMHKAVESGMDAAMEVAVTGGKERLQGHVVTGGLRASIQKKRVAYNEGIVGSNKTYARYVEDGTGVYGPNQRAIMPRHARRLAWFPKTVTGTPQKGSGKIVRRQVKGQRPVHYMANTLAQDQNRMRDAFKTAFSRSLH